MNTQNTPDNQAPGTTRRDFTKLAATAAAASALPTAAQAAASGRYDLVITGGRVIDPETGLDAVRNVGIKDGKIAAVTEKGIDGKETIDATGHVVSSGFIDMYNHNAGYPFG